MHGQYPGGLRIRVIDFVEGGGSRREAADQLDVSVSSAIRWVQRFREEGTCEPMPRGGSTSPLEKHSRRILAVISAQPDLTLVDCARTPASSMERQRCAVTTASPPSTASAITGMTPAPSFTPSI